MIGFGGFGGYSFPTRRSMAAPQSGQVMSDQEFGLSWRDKLNSTPQFNTTTETVELVPGNAGYTPATAIPALNEINQNQRAEWDRQAAGWSQADRDANWLAAKNMGYIPTIGADGALQLSIDAYNNNMNSAGRSMADGRGFAGSHTTTLTNSTLNPEWNRVQSDWMEADKQRTENNIRQQQAYNTYLAGDGQIGGVMGEQYRNPAFGQVSGQQPGDVLTGMPGISGITGVDDTSAMGGYTGGAGRYNPSPYAPDAFKNRNPWSGL